MKISPLRLAFAVLCCVLCSATVASAQGRYLYDFLRNDASARSAAMAGTFITVTNDPVGIYYNPALLTTVDTLQAAFTFFKHVLDINSGSATMATNIEDIGYVGAGISYNSGGAFDRVDRTGQQIGEFGASDIVAVIGWGTKLGEGFSAGVNGKAIFSTIDNYGAMALALDGGLLYVDTANRVQAGLSLLHLGSQVSSFGVDKEDLPLDLKLGISHQLRGLPLLVALNFSRLLDDQEDFISRFRAFSVGGEFTLSRPLRLRLGYDNRVRQDVPFGQSKGLSGLSGGLGVLVKDYRFDYSFSSLDQIGAVHRVSVNAKF